MLEDVKLVEHIEEGKGILTQNRVCLVCNQQVSRYTCPKCNIAYCSLACYKVHGEGCTDTFYQQNLMESLKNERSTEEEKEKMMQVLARIQEEQQQEEEEEFPDNLSQLNLEDESSLTLDCLTKEQQADFRRALADGTLGQLIEIWIPWWTKEENKRWNPLITVIDGSPTESEKDSTTQSSNVPAILSSIPPLSKFLQKPPSPFLAFNLIDILFAYGYVQRLYNGDTTVDIIEAGEMTLTLSSVLGNNAVHETIPSSIHTALENSLKPSIGSSNEFSISILKDVSAILGAQRLVLIALSDFHELLGRTATSVAQAKQKKIFSLAQKKLLFFLSWANENEDGFFKLLGDAVEQVWTEATQSRQEGKAKRKEGN